jgi:hypothetical protein
MYFVALVGALLRLSESDRLRMSGDEQRRVGMPTAASGR